jgi:hypothetical protein
VHLTVVYDVQQSLVMIGVVAVVAVVAVVFGNENVVEQPIVLMMMMRVHYNVH